VSLQQQIEFGGELQMNTAATRIVTAGIAGIALLAAGAGWSTNAQAQTLAMATEQSGYGSSAVVTPQQGTVDDATADIPARLRRQIVDYPTSEPAGTVIVDTPNTYLYFVLSGGKAIRYGIGVGRDGFTWSGTKTIERKTEWPDWYPPADMLQRQPYLPRFMAGGPGNPLGARAMYLSGTVYRIHGTNKPSSIGTHASSGCIRMLNADVTDLYERTHVGTKVVVLPQSGRQVAQAAPSTTSRSLKRGGIFDETMR
jgi:lipoprotein-anchoring transpeptidase ErfK/SrfK